jgi:hypothetical protein
LKEIEETIRAQITATRLADLGERTFIRLDHGCHESHFQHTVAPQIPPISAHGLKVPSQAAANFL